MYNYDFNNEKVIYENTNAYININDKELICSVLITDKNILFFQNIAKDNPLNAKLVQIMPEYELIYKVKLENLNYKVENNDTILKKDKVILFNINIDSCK